MQREKDFISHSVFQGHYRFCDALSLLGQQMKALQANEKGQNLCRDSPEGIKDLIQQHEKLKKQMEEIKGNSLSTLRESQNQSSIFCDSN